MANKAMVRNPGDCFCQSQYCKYRVENRCTKYDKRIIGTYICEDFEMNENVDLVGGRYEKDN